MSAHPLFAQLLRDFEDMHPRVERARVKPEDNADDEALPVVERPMPVSQNEGGD